MPYSISICKNGFYRINYRGSVDYALRLEALRAVEASSRNTPIRGNLIDFRMADLNCSFAEQFAFATKATEQPGHRGRKVALLVDPSPRDHYAILQLAMTNRGIETRLFTDEFEAIAWLTGGLCSDCEDQHSPSCALHKSVAA